MCNREGVQEYTSRGGRLCNRKRTREHASESMSLLLSAKLPSVSDKKHMEYQPTRKRIQKAREHQIEIYEVEQLEEEEEKSPAMPVPAPDFPVGILTNSPTFYPIIGKEMTSDRNRIREHAPGVTSLLSAKLPSASDQQRMKYHPMRKRIQEAGKHQIEIYEVELEEEEEKSPAMPIPSPDFSDVIIIHSPTFYPTIDKESTTDIKRTREHDSDVAPLLSAKLTSASDQQNMKYQPKREDPIRRTSNRNPRSGAGG